MVAEISGTVESLVAKLCKPQTWKDYTGEFSPDIDFNKMKIELVDKRHSRKINWPNFGQFLL